MDSRVVVEAGNLLKELGFRDCGREMDELASYLSLFGSLQLHTNIGGRVRAISDLDDLERRLVASIDLLGL